jgi:hypothetical protein
VPIAAGHIVVRDGLPMTSRPWTLCDYLPTLTEGASVTLLDRALQQRWITPADIAARLREYPKRRGNTRLRLLLDLTGDGAAAMSERILHALLRQANIEGWRPNYPVRFNAAVIAASTSRLSSAGSRSRLTAWLFTSARIGFRAIAPDRTI